MAATAGAIAAGDLTRRVERADARTEVGRLGLALNAMLAQIEEAFTRSRNSENALRRFLAQASHELRTPLSSIRGYAELFRRGAREHPEDLDLAMRRIEQEAARMGVLVEELLLLARLDEGRAARPRARRPDPARRRRRGRRPDRRPRTRRRAASRPGRWACWATTAGCARSSTNLVINALRHAGRRGPSRGRARARPTARPSSRWQTTASACRDDVAARVFEPFYRSARRARSRRRHGRPRPVDRGRHRRGPRRHGRAADDPGPGRALPRARLPLAAEPICRRRPLRPDHRADISRTPREPSVGLDIEDDSSEARGRTMRPGGRRGLSARKPSDVRGPLHT